MRIRSEEDNVDVPLASFMDCAFLLLIFFLVTAIMKKPHKAIPIVLPEVSHAALQPTPDKQMVITLQPRFKAGPRGSSGEYEGATVYVDGQQMTLATFPSVLRKAASADPNQKIRVDIDENVRWRDIAYVTDLIQFEGLSQVNFKTRNPVETGR